MEVHQLIWVSAAIRPFTGDELEQLLTRNRPSNQSRGITGLLLYDHGSFLQLMEGPEAEVEFVFENRILRDKRHTDITLLLRRNVAERNFPGWSMGFFDTSTHPLHLLPGFHDFDKTWGRLLDLHGDRKKIDAIVDGFHKGQWHKFEQGRR